MAIADASWTLSDIVAAWTAITYTALGVWLRPSNRNADQIGILLSTGISLGPLLMILSDPFVQQMGLNLHLVERVVVEARAILWWASAVAVASLTRKLI